MNILNLNPYDAHDRLLHIKKEQSANVFKGAEDCLKSNTLSLALQEKSPYVYLYAHPRSGDDGYTKILYWQPRLSRPYPETNSYLFRAISKTDLIEVCWIIPPKEQWKEYQKGNVTESEIINWSINQYTNKRNELSQPHPEDLSDEMGGKILKAVLLEHEESLRKSKLITPA